MMLPEGFSPPSPAPGIGYGVKTWQSEVFDILPSGLLVLDADGVIVYANSAATRFLGAPRDRLLGRIALDPCRHIVHEDGVDFPGDQHPAAVALRTGAPVLGCVMGVAIPVLGVRWLRVDAVPTLDQAGKPVQVVVSMTDVTARHVAAEQIGRVYAALAGGVLMLDGEGRIRDANVTAEALLGASKAEMRGHILVQSPWRGVIEDGVLGEGEHPVTRALTSGKAIRQATLCLPAPTGGTSWLQIDAVPLLDDFGGVDQVVVSFIDITGRVVAERALRASEERLAHAFNEAALGMAQVDHAGKMLHVNPAMSALLGYGADKLVDMTLDQVMLAEDVDQTKDLTQRSLAGELDQFQVERRFMRMDGRIIWVRVTSRPVRDRQDRFLYFVSQFEDITARMRIRHATEEPARLRADQAAQAEALAAMSSALTGELDHAALYAGLLEQAGRILPCDQAAVVTHENGWAVIAALWGSPNVPVGTKLFPIAGPDAPWMPGDRAAAIYLNDTAAAAGWVDWVGDRRINAVLIAPFVVDGEYVGALCLHSFTAGRYKPEHLPLATLLAERMSPALRGARLYAAEQERARSAEELVLLRNEFVATVSHELRSPLTAILGYGELLQAYWKDMTDAARRERVDRIVDSAHRQQRLVEDLLLISRLEVGALSVRLAAWRIRHLAYKAVQEVRANYRDQRIDLRGPNDLWARVDGDRVTQIVVNLTDNAAKYSPENAPVEIEWAEEELPNGASANLCPCRGVILRVTDHGPGLPAEGRERLFERFGRLRGSRSRAGHVGTGLGLYLSRRLAEAMDGTLDLESTGPLGTVFRLRLPLAAPPTDSAGLSSGTRQGEEHDRRRTKSRG